MDIALYPGEIHAILGENGAGKSTLVAIFSGNLAPDSGDILENNQPVVFGNARAARRHGIDIVQQHFMLVPAFMVEENLRLTSMDRRRSAAPALEFADSLGWKIDPKAVTASLSVGALQRVEIIKALASGSRVVLFDEPTAALSPDETADLFDVMRKLRDEGRAIVLITHKLDEALSVADRVTVLRRGRTVVSVPAKGVAAEQLARWMVGEVPAALNKPKTAAGDVRVRGELQVDGGSFTIGAGEIVGFGGVAGNGQVELAESLVGIRPFSGKLEVNAKHIAYIPEDRQRDGLALTMSILENLLIEGHRKKALAPWALFIPRRVRAWCETIVAKFSISVQSIDDPASSLSGGNQQKVIVGRSLEFDPDFIVSVNPTRGLDVRAEHYVHTQLIDAKAKGAAIALFSNDLEELAKLADRTYFMNSGKLLSGGNVAEMIGGRE
ncbi:MAG: ATP-binding cassette domain-containing protein [Armatimonadota bacterium]|nr:ATP-binding cassette domain-containing protein [Armatimonadota bacterium]